MAIKKLFLGLAYPWRGAQRRCAVFVTVEFKDGRLSLQGEIGPNGSGNASSCGQIVGSLAKGGEVHGWQFAEGWNFTRLAVLRDTWNRWHLNDMKAGSLAQEAHLRGLTWDRATDGEHYPWALKVLAEAGLQPDADGYSYGSAWKREEVPPEVIDLLWSLPDAARPHPWGSR